MAGDARAEGQPVSDLLRKVRALDPWFHDLDLGHGIRTKRAPCADEPPDHPRPTWEIVRRFLPADLSGRTVLDAGCNAGFYSFEVRRLGAATVVGIDSQRREIAQARLAAGILGLDVAFRRRSVYDLSIEEDGRFDFVLALGLLYHCRHPALALEKLAEVTGDTLVLESAGAPESEGTGPRWHTVGGLSRRLLPAFYVENALDSKEAVYNWFLPSVSCLEGFLSAEGFGKVAHVPVSPERSLFVATRRGKGRESGSRPGFRAKLSLVSGPREARASGRLAFRVRAWNVGTAVWPSFLGRETAKGALLLGVHLLDSDENVIEWDFRRFRAALPREVAPGGSADFEVAIEAPGKTGDFFLEFDLVLEYTGWFEELGSAPLKSRLRVTG